MALSLFLEAMFRTPAPVPEAAPVAQAATDRPPVVPDPAPALTRHAEFDAMLVDLGLLRLAVPLVDLDGVLPMPERWVEIPRQAQWVIGVASAQGRNTTVVDTARLVMPDQHRGAVPDYRHVVLIGDGRWGLACVSVSDVFRVGRDAVRHRRHRRSRPWLAGTLIDHLSGLVDVSRLLACLEQGTF